jgi:hypothetical protein
MNKRIPISRTEAVFSPDAGDEPGSNVRPSSKHLRCFPASLSVMFSFPNRASESAIKLSSNRIKVVVRVHLLGI